MGLDAEATEAISRRAVMALLGAVAGCSDATSAARKSALVIGNSSYRFGRLKNAVEDARAVATVLGEIGYAVTTQFDVMRDGLIEAMKSFASRSRGSNVRLVYYSGHGIQYKDVNYLVAIDSNLHSEADIPTRCPSFSELVRALDTGRGRANIFILDACRMNPFVDGVFMGPDGQLRRLARPRASDDVRPGLNEMDAPSGTYVAFAASPNAPAFDGPGGEGSYFTRHLIANIRKPGVPIEQLFKRVREAVMTETNGQQIPWESSSLRGDFCFVPRANGRCGG